jgi:hypothetical protein
MTTTHKRSFWHTHIAQWQEAGMTQLAYCHQHQLCPHKFGYYKRTLVTKTGADSGQTSPSGFVSVQLRPQQSQVDALTLHFANGIHLSGVSAHNIAVVKQLAEALL